MHQLGISPTAEIKKSVALSATLIALIYIINLYERSPLTVKDEKVDFWGLNGPYLLTFKPLYSMKTIIKNACGLDVHQATITACIDPGKQKQIKEFGTTTQELEELKKWLKQNQITHVAMESSGVYWKPVFNIIGEDFEILLVNARHSIPKDYI